MLTFLSHWIPFCFFLGACSSSDGLDAIITPPPPSQPKEWTFETEPIWADEFAYSGKPDPEKWGYDLGGGGWGNNEWQYYTDALENAAVDDGILRIRAVKESIAGRDYSSARIVSRGKGDFLYGRIEVRARLPKGRGTWPAIWMLPTDWAYGDWPRSGEIDIMEHVGFDEGRIHMSVHTEQYNHVKGTQKTQSKEVEGVTEAFHTYRMDWTPEAVRGYVDDRLLFEFRNEGKGVGVWPFDKRFHLLMNIAVGGDWGGMQGVDDAIFPQVMEVDYVRVYKMVEKK